MASSTVFKEFFTRKRHRIAENWFANVLECGVCGEQFSISGEKVPRLLLCGHSFCHNCLTRLPLCDGNLACPMDRQITEVGGGGIWSLKKNFALIELMEKLQIRGLGQMSPNSVSRISPDVKKEEQKKQGPRCDEDESHVATLYCLVCCTNLCADCALSIHSTKTLSKHRRVALEDKPTEPIMCPLHQTHALEFSCLDPNCQFNPAMCYLCKEHGQHKGHQYGLLEVIAQKCRASAQEAADRASHFLSQVEEHSNKIEQSINLIEGMSPVSVNQSGSVLRQQLPGTLVSARQCVKDYFSRLHDTLSNQEDAALNNLEGHVRSRVTALRRIHDDTTSLHSHISAALTHCNDVLNQDEPSILCSRQEIDALDQMFDQQQRQFNEQISTSTDDLDPSIPVTFTKDNRIHIGRKLEIRVVTLGLDGAGKTTLLFKLKQDEFMQPIPTIGFNVETVDFRNLRFTVWDVGGKHKLRPLWKHYYLNTQAVLFVVDSCDSERLEEAHQELAKLMSEKDLRDAALLVLANKQDLPGAMSCEELTVKLNLHKLCCGRSWRALPCDAPTGSGLEEALNWLSRQLLAAGVLEVV